MLDISGAHDAQLISVMGIEFDVIIGYGLYTGWEYRVQLNDFTV